MNPLSIHKEHESMFSLMEVQDYNKVHWATKENRRSNKSIPFRKHNVKKQVAITVS
jgi:hypothetical protein